MADWTRRSDTRDPCKVLMEREGRSCKGCKHRELLWNKAICIRSGKPADNKCTQYKEVE